MKFLPQWICELRLPLFVPGEVRGIGKRRLKLKSRTSLHTSNCFPISESGKRNHTSRWISYGNVNQPSAPRSQPTASCMCYQSINCEVLGTKHFLCRTLGAFFSFLVTWPVAQRKLVKWQWMELRCKLRCTGWECCFQSNNFLPLSSNSRDYMDSDIERCSIILG